VRAALRRLVESPAFIELMTVSRVGAGRTTERAPGDATQIYRLLKGLHSLHAGTGYQRAQARRSSSAGRTLER
jgi:hypothetical protein